MLNQEIKYFLFIVLMLFISCIKNDDHRNKNIIEISRATIGDSEYNRIYKQAVDSLKIWEVAKLPSYEWAWYYKYQLDSVLCFNSAKDRMVGAVLVQCDQPTCLLDDVHYFYGVKIKKQWYFLNGPTMYLDREHYQSDIHTPLSFEKLHDLAMQNIFRGYLKKNKKDEWKINDTFFTSRLEGVGWGDFNNQPKEDWFLKGKRFANQKDYYEFIYMDVVKKNWSVK